MLKLFLKLIFSLISILTTQMLNAQVDMFTGANKGTGHLEYKVFFGQSGLAEKRYLENKGYENVQFRSGYRDSSMSIPAGYYIVLKATCPENNDWDKKSNTRFIVAYSKHSFESAERKAAECIPAEMWCWKKSYGYEVVEKNTFDNNAPQNNIIYVATGSTDEKGNEKVNNLVFMVKSGLTKKEYETLKSKTDRKDYKTNSFVAVDRIVANSGKVALCKCKQMLSNGLYKESYKAFYAPTGGNYEIEFSNEIVTTQAGEKCKYFKVAELDIDKMMEDSKQDPGIFKKMDNDFRKVITNPEQKNEPPKKTSSIGVRD